MAKQHLIERFWSRVDKSGGEDACWPWLATKDHRGYGGLSINDRSVKAHRVALELHLGRPIAVGACALHSCDNPPCVNPAHLREGTLAENSREMSLKGRAAFGDRNGSRLHPERLPRGERTHLAKLREQDVRDIRAHFAAGGLCTNAVAAQYNVTTGALRHIKAGRSWVHVQ